VHTALYSLSTLRYLGILLCTAIVHSHILSILLFTALVHSDILLYCFLSLGTLMSVYTALYSLSTLRYLSILLCTALVISDIWVYCFLQPYFTHISEYVAFYSLSTLRYLSVLLCTALVLAYNICKTCDKLQIRFILYKTSVWSIRISYMDRFFVVMNFNKILII